MTGLNSSKLNQGSAAENMRRGLVRFAGPAILAVEVGLVAGLAVMVAKVGWLLVEPGGAVSEVAPLRQTARATSDQSLRALNGDVTLLTTTNPFGAEVVAEVVIPDAPETTLNLKLRGLRMTGENGAGVAMIVLPDNRTQTFRVGDAILDDVTLERVFADRVTLRKSGQIEALLMPSGMDHLSVLTVPGEAPKAGAAGIAPSGAGAIVADAALTDFLTSLVINPVHSGEAFVGYEITARGDAAILTGTGIEPGDIVVGVDGTPIESLAPGDLARKFASSKSLRLRINRDGRVLEQTFAPPEAR